MPSNSPSLTSFLGSPQFQKIIKDAVTEGVTEGGQISRKLKAAEVALSKSEKYKRWAKTLDQSDSLKLANVGLVSYLLGSEEETE